MLDWSKEPANKRCVPAIQNYFLCGVLYSRPRKLRARRPRVCKMATECLEDVCARGSKFLQSPGAHEECGNLLGSDGSWMQSPLRSITDDHVAFVARCQVGPRFRLVRSLSRWKTISPLRCRCGGPRSDVATCSTATRCLRLDGTGKARRAGATSQHGSVHALTTHLEVAAASRHALRTARRLLGPKNVCRTAHHGVSALYARL
jgi:hypothetical protein